MDAEDKIRFEPVWVTTLGLIPFFFIYKVGDLFIKDGMVNWASDAPMLLFPVLTSLVFLPMFLKMIFGTPALQFTGDELVDNLVGVRVRWENVENIRISGSYKPFLSIDLKDSDEFYSSIRNPLKRILLKGLFALASGDVPINLAFVAGNDEAAVALAKVYWNRYYGVTD